MAAGIVTAVSNVCAGGNHASITVTAPNGQSVTVPRTVLDDGPLSSAEWEAFVAYSVRALRFQKGVTLSDFLNRVCIGDEANNLKHATLFGPGAAIPRTNIGTTYTNGLPGANGERVPLDFTGATEFLIFGAASFGQTGHGIRIIRDSNGDVLFENASINATGEQELLSNGGSFATLPAAFQGLSGNIAIRIQHKAPAGNSSATLRHCKVMLR